MYSQITFSLKKPDIEKSFYKHHGLKYLCYGLYQFDNKIDCKHQWNKKKKNFINTFFKIKDNRINIVYTFFLLEITLKMTFV